MRFEWDSEIAYSLNSLTDGILIGFTDRVGLKPIYNAAPCSPITDAVCSQKQRKC